MSQPFLAEVRIFGFTFPPRGWSQCDGQILPINQYQSLYSLLGTTYGGDGRTTFGLPEMRGRCCMSPNGSTFKQGQKGGQQTHTLIAGETPTHTHGVLATNTTSDKNLPTNNVLGTTGVALYAAPNNLTPLAPTLIKNTGGNQSHENMSPYLVVNFCIAMQGLFPSRN